MSDNIDERGNQRRDHTLSMLPARDDAMTKRGASDAPNEAGARTTAWRAFYVAGGWLAMVSVVVAKSWVHPALSFLPGLAVIGVLAAKRWGGWRRDLILSALISAIVLIITVTTIPVVVRSWTELTHVRFGWPLPWLLQDLSLFDPPFPWSLTSAQLDSVVSTRILWFQFLLSFALIWVPTTVIVAWCRTGPRRSGMRGSRRTVVSVLVALLVVTTGSVVTLRGARAESSVRSLPTLQDARSVLEAAVSRAEDHDREGLCALGGAVSHCRSSYVSMGGDDAVPNRLPRVVASRVMEQDDGRTPGRILILNGVDGLGRAYDTEFLVFSDGSKPIALNPVYWNGIELADGAVQDG